MKWTIFNGIFISLFVLNPLFAQDTDQQRDRDDLGNEQVEVVKEFNPMVSDAVKEKFRASLPEYKGEKLEFIYDDAPERVIVFPFSPEAAKPLSIPSQKAENFASSYIKAGFGTQLSPLVEVLFNEGKKGKNDGKFEKMNYGAFFRHHSARASKIEHQDFSENYGKVFNNMYFKNARWNTELSYKRDAVFYYGHNIASDTSFARKDIKQHYNDFNVKTQVLNTQNNKKAFNYQVDLEFDYFSDRRDMKEYFINFDIATEKIFKEKHFLKINFSEDYSALDRSAGQLNRNIASLAPKYEFNDQTWRVFGGVNFTYEDKTFHVFPDLGLERQLWKEYILFYSGWKMELRKNSFRSFARDNPWVGEDFTLLNTRVEDRFMGVKGKVGKFYYNGKLAQKAIRKLPVFINDSTRNMQTFDVLYDRKTNILNLHIELSYDINKNIGFDFFGDYYMYEMDQIRKAYHLPRFDIHFLARYNYGDKVFINFDMFARDGVYALIPGNEDIRLKGFADFNIRGTYKFSDYLSFFADFNNIASMKYQRYYLYPGYGFNCKLGGILTF
ncbi:MAG: hypothetical protein WD334_01205 [Chitinophagales bacterium]